MNLKFLGYSKLQKDSSEIIFMDNNIAIAPLKYVRDYSFKRDQEKYGLYYIKPINMEDWVKIIKEIAETMEEKDHAIICYENKYEEFDTTDLEEAIMGNNKTEIEKIIKEVYECEEEIDQIIIDKFISGKHTRIELNKHLIITVDDRTDKGLEFLLNLKSFQEFLKEETKGNMFSTYNQRVNRAKEEERLIAENIASKGLVIKSVNKPKQAVLRRANFLKNQYRGKRG